MTPAKPKADSAVDRVEHPNLAEALAAFQAEAPVLPQAGSNPAFGGSKYTKLQDAIPVIQPLMARHGLVWSAKPGRSDDGELVLRYRLLHAPSLESDDGELPLMLDRQNMQGLGSAVTYARRQAMFAQLNLVGDDDDDGNVAAQARQQSYSPAGQPRQQQRRTGASPAQRKLIKDLAGQKSVGRDRLGELAGVPVQDGWMDKLTPGQGGTASALIDALMGLPDPEPEPAPSDVPEPEPGEYEHPPVSDADDVPFDAQPEEATDAS